ncbi:hypothetical protein [Natronolimnobius baerhuensis]|uniref:DUF7981 domain-containing protein n=1 Tax=Natronolimnobius baerhuensis TaxID=253108 RepID=A0A202E6U4_9EURY|nr:hypothetical protein [Natronolimnobius baerhuensis]OVE83981.1 hypothetical protein B2G88_16390 [Natronolimnobius baerhuensis]
MPSPISLRPRVKSALLWGAVGFMAFLVLVQGYALVVEPLVSITQGAGIALLVAAGTAAGAYVLEHRIAAWSAQRAVSETNSHNDAD